MRFRNLTMTVSAGCLVTQLLLSAIAAGQDAEPPRGIVGMVRQLIDANVQQELELTEKQIAEAEQVAELLAQVRDGKAQSQAERQLSASLTAKQLKRLKQIHWQSLDGYALLESDVSAALEITEQQRKKLFEAQTTNVAEHQKMRDFMSRARFRSREAMEQFREKYRTAANQRLRTVLTPEQVKAFDEMLGERIESR